MDDFARFNGASRASRRELRQRRERERKLVLRHRWYAGGIATVISAALIFAGVGAPAMADDATPTPTVTDTADPTPPADDTTTPPADDTTTPPADDTTTPPADDTTTPPADDTTTPPADTTTDPTATPTPTDPGTSDPGTIDKNAVVAPLAGDAGDVGILAVPAPGAGQAVITVKVGSDRTGITGVTPLAGRRAAPEQRRCEWPERHPPRRCRRHRCRLGDLHLRRGRRLLVRRAEHTGGRRRNPCRRQPRRALLGRPPAERAPAGYYTNPTLRTGGSSGAGTATPYTFRTGTQLRAGTTYSSQNANDFMLSSGDAGHRIGRHLAAVARQPRQADVVWSRRRADPRPVRLGRPAPSHS